MNCDTLSQGGGKFFRELDAPQLGCGVLHLEIGIWDLDIVIS